MKKASTIVVVILVTLIIMLVPQLIHTGFQLAEVDWQSVVVRSLLIDVCVYLGFAYANKNKDKDKDNK